MADAEGPAGRGGPGRGGLDDRQVRQLLAIGAIVLVAVLALAFVVENTDRVSVSFVLFSMRVSLIWVMLVSLAAGLVAGVALAVLAQRRYRRGRDG